MSPEGIEIQEAKTWVCLVCSKQYKYLGALENHIEKEHPDAWDTAKKAEEEAARSVPASAPETPEEFEAVAMGGPGGEELEAFVPEIETKTFEDLEAEIRRLKREVVELRLEAGELKEDIADFEEIEGEDPLPAFAVSGVPTEAQKQYPFEEIWEASSDGDRQLLQEAVAKARPPAQLEDVASFAFYDTEVVFVLMDGRKIRVHTTQK